MPLLSRSGQDQTRILLDGAEDVSVTEPTDAVLAAMNEAWAELHLDDETVIHVRTSSVVAVHNIVHPD
jgi:hypothetical protein